MLRNLFRLPITEWRQHLKEHRGMLGPDFFKNVERRIRWGVENNHIDDAFRFAMVGDFGSEVKGRPANFRIDLAEIFFKAENYLMTAQIAENIIITSPNGSAANRAWFLKARLYEMQKNYFAAHEVYTKLGNKRFDPANSWLKAGQISLLVQKEGRAKEELAKASKAGSREAGELLMRIKAAENRGWDSIAPVPNTTPNPKAPSTNGASSPSKALVAARLDVANKQLDSANQKYKQLLASDPKNLEALQEWTALLYRTGDLVQAKVEADKALGFYPRDVKLLRTRANTMERLFDRSGRQVDLEAAIKDYQAASSASPNHRFLPIELKRATAKRK